MHLGAGQHITVQRGDEGSKQRTALTDPAGQGRPFQIDTLAGVNVALPVQRQMIAVFGHENMRQQAGTGSAFGNRPFGASA
jgi:hypothetical protein